MVLFLKFLGIVAILIASFIFIGRCWAIKKYPTLYDVIEKKLWRSRNASEVLDKPYDFFVSYKSDDACLIRPLVEQMLSSGISVWFAEYNIVLNGREDFEKAIAAGISNSKFGLCFTNSQYFASKHCCDELEQLLLPQNCGPERIIQIELAAADLLDQKYPELDAVTTINLRTDLNLLAKKISEITEIEIQLKIPQTPISPRYQTFNYGSQQYQLSYKGWTMEAKERPVRKEFGEARGPRFSRWIGKYQVSCHLHIGTSIAFPRAHSERNDRENFEYAIKFARAHYRMYPAQCIGVHLFFLNGLSHIALTARTAKGWRRTYSVIVPLSGNSQYVEFVFDFYIKCSFNDFCQNVHLMDRIVKSFKWIE